MPNSLTWFFLGKIIKCPNVMPMTTAEEVRNCVTTQMAASSGRFHLLNKNKTIFEFSFRMI
jgi:hypothetical protein